ncbi:PIG-L family deacetylase [Methanolobus sp. WCC4]|uniref:PIG-L deacetylase family protein n=1 Tax=Methanolobus sp. WCC4 TaxID=3125784 RepID=UPI0030F70AC6
MANVLAVGAHPDDVEIGCGGTVAKHISKGDNVVIVIMIEPVSFHYSGKSIRSKDEGHTESKNAVDIMGAKLINLGFKDKNVPYSQETIEALNRIIDEYNIDIIYTHWYHDTHQDHKRTTESVISAGRYVHNILMYEPEYPAGRSYLGFRNQYYVDISNEFNVKMDALKCHKSQIERYGDDFLKAVEARAIHRGYEIRTKYAECFEVLRMMDDIQ